MERDARVNMVLVYPGQDERPFEKPNRKATLSVLDACIYRLFVPAVGVTGGKSPPRILFAIV